MAGTKGNGRNAGHAAPAKTLNKYTVDSTGNDLVLITTTTEARADTRSLAAQLRVAHHNTLALLVKHLADFEEFGKVLFKTEPSSDSRTGQKEKFAMLNEDQSFLLLTYSRNTARVRSLKVRLVKAFGEVRRVADMRQREYLPSYHAMHDQIKYLANGSPNQQFMHMNMNREINKIAGIESGRRASAPVCKQAVLIVAQMIAIDALQRAPNSEAGYRLAKHAMAPLIAASMLEIAQ